MDLASPVFNHFRLPMHHEDDCALHPTNVQRLIVLVQHEDRDIDFLHTLILDRGTKRAFRKEFADQQVIIPSSSERHATTSFYPKV
jgi:hypothetical protein